MQGIIITRGDNVYSYTKKGNKKARQYVLLGFSAVLVLSVGILSYSYMQNQNKPADQSVFAEAKIPVITLPPTSEKAIRPYNGEGKIVLDYYDGKTGDVESISEFEGVYRANQGIDYAMDNQNFDVVAIYGGSVSDVRDDALFGKTVVIKTGDVTITYQSLADTKLKKGDAVKQGDVISQASTNIYNKDLGNHVHIAVVKNGKIIDPESIYNQKASEIK